VSVHNLRSPRNPHDTSALNSYVGRVPVRFNAP